MQVRRNPALDTRRFWCCVCHKYLSNRSSMKRHTAEYHHLPSTLMQGDPRFPNRWLCAPWGLPSKPSVFPYGEEDWGTLSNNKRTT